MSSYVELTLEQGATFTTTVTVSDANGDLMDLTDYTAKASMRKSYYSTTSTDFTVTIPDPLSGELLITMSATITAVLAPGRYVYDVILIAPDETTVTRVFEGTVAVTPGVTQNG